MMSFKEIFRGTRRKENPEIIKMREELVELENYSERQRKTRARLKARLDVLSVELDNLARRPPRGNRTV